MTFAGSRRHLAPVAIVAAVVMAGCSLLPDEAPLLGPADCFGDVEYSFSGWAQTAEIGQHEGPANGRVFAMVTREEIVLSVSPPNLDGGTDSILGRGVCWTWPDANLVAKAALGQTRRQPNP